MKKKAETRLRAADAFKPARVPVPRRVRAVSSLWLSFFEMALEAILAHEETPDAVTVARKAREIADAAMDQYEERWPEVQP